MDAQAVVEMIGRARHRAMAAGLNPVAVELTPASLAALAHHHSGVSIVSFSHYLGLELRQADSEAAQSVMCLARKPGRYEVPRYTREPLTPSPSSASPRAA